MTINWEPLGEIIDSNQRFVLSSHVRPDADALGSELALAGLLEQMGKSVRIVNPSAMGDHLKFMDPEGRILKLGEGITADEICETDVHIILDTSAWAQLNDVGSVFRRSPATKVVVDHHVSSDNLDAVEFKDTKAEATGSLIFQLAEFLNVPITVPIANALFCAIATDTGWFRFPSTTGETMRTVGRLIDLGVQQHLIYQQLYEQHSFARVKLAGIVLSRVALDFEGQLAYTYVKRDDFQQTGAHPSDTEDLVNECLKIAGTKCAFIAVEQRTRQIKISFRSRVGLDVAQIAEQFGGGGHKQAAGAMLPGPLEDARSKVLSAIETVLKGQSEAVPKST